MSSTLLPSSRRAVRNGQITVAIFAAILVGWGSFARLDEAVLAEGVVVTSIRAYDVEHFEGGVVSAVNVENGDRVQPGEILAELAPIDLSSEQQQSLLAAISLRIEAARIAAQVVGAVYFEPPDEVGIPENLRPLVVPMIEAARADFDATIEAERRARLAMQQSVTVLMSQADAATLQVQHVDKEHSLLLQELGGLQRLADQGYAPLSRLRAAERAVVSNRRDRQKLQGEIISFTERARETRLQFEVQRASEKADLSARLRAIQTELSALSPRIRNYDDRLKRVQLISPMAGSVFNLNLSPGMILEPGTPLLTISPTKGGVHVEAQLSPTAADDVRPGQQVEVRVLAFNEQDGPYVRGTLQSVSADALTDDQGKAYFHARVSIEHVTSRRPLTPGLPVEVTIPLRRRTALEYFVEPLTRNFRRAFHEH